jgi:hypothetical protein
MKITKGAVVIMNGMKIGNLYKLLGTQLQVELQLPPQQNQILIILFCGICGLVI